MVTVRAILRADGGPQIGVGHIMRMVALAQAIEDSGGKAWLATTRLSAELAQFVKSHGVTLLERTFDTASKEDSDWVHDLVDTYQADWIGVDGYAFSVDYMTALRSTPARVLLVDDYGRAPCDVDLILNQNIYADQELYTEWPEKIRRLLGLRHVLLRREFIHQAIAPRFAKERFLVILGGADPRRLTPQVVDALCTDSDSARTIRVLVGPSADRYEARDARVQIIRGEDVAAHMLWADLAIAAAGTTTYELVRLSVPALLLCVAENQRPIAAGMAECGVAVNLGWWEDLQAASLLQTVDNLSPKDLQAMTECAAKLVDGKGAGRVVQQMMRTYEREA